MEVAASFEVRVSMRTNEVPAPLQAGASIERLASVTYEVPAPLQAGAGTNFTSDEAVASFEPRVSTNTNEVPVLVQAEARTKLAASIADKVPAPEQVSEEVAASFELQVSNEPAQAFTGTEFIHREPEPVVVGPIQPLLFLTVNKFIPWDPDILPPFQALPPDLTLESLLSHDVSPMMKAGAATKEKTLSGQS